jgi:hypothetical protein
LTGTDLTSTHEDDPDTANEVRALSALAFEELRSFPGAIRDMHLGIAERAFRGVGPAGRPVQVIHDALSRRAYDAVGSGAALLGRAADVGIERQGIGQDVPLSTTPGGSAIIGALNGLMGDRLERSQSDPHRALPLWVPCGSYRSVVTENTGESPPASPPSLSCR